MSYGLIILLLTALQNQPELTPLPCSLCHQAESWRTLAYPSPFNHDETSFPLQGSHRLQPCNACHTGGTLQEKHQFQLGSVECSDCHLDIHLSDLGSECTRCHDSNTWQVTSQTFDHEFTRFSLFGSHRSVPCRTCHTELDMTQFNALSTDCYYCHRINFDEAQEPSHIDNNFSTDCELCHTVQKPSWTSTFDHGLTEFPLTGLHRTAACNQCHNGEIYDLPLLCEGCHIPGELAETNYETSEYDHTSHQIDDECASCHSTAGWQELLFKHTLFLATPCEACHQVEYQATSEPDHQIYGYPPETCNSCHNNFEWTPSIFEHTLALGCVTCHMPDYEQVVEPLHTPETGYSYSCEKCHFSTTTWEGAELDHSLTAFPLTGIHKTTECGLCHTGGVFDLPSDCEGCHFPGGLATTNYETSTYDHPAHQIANECASCHSTESWQDLLFNHADFVNRGCRQCHLIEHTLSEDPPHANGNINTDCKSCHETSQWTIDSFLHSLAQTNFALIGLHAGIPCVNCHPNNNFAGIETNCQGSTCHLTDFQSTTDPDHQLYGYPPEECASCHSETIGWKPDKYAHELSLACATCHLQNYYSTTDPDHSAPGYNTSCATCHVSTDNWQDAVFDHTSVTTPCVDCHLTDYQNTTNPDHNTGGYSTDCISCHNSTTNWNDTSFDHDNLYFPIYTGEHKNKWTTCTAECHPDLQNYSNFSCGLNGVCHKHRKDKMDSEHRGIGGYNYENQACFDCHPTGDENEGGGGDDKSGRDWREHIKNRKPRKAR